MTSSHLGQQLYFEPFKHLAQDTKKSGELKTLFGAQGTKSLVAPFKFPASAYEYKVIALRECVHPQKRPLCDTPQAAADYWRWNIPHNPYYNPECECLAAIMLDTRRRAKGHYLISLGTMDTLLVHPREVFRLAVMTSASALVLAHNHPSGDPSPSEADIKSTRDMIRAGQFMKIEVLDHIVIGQPNHASLRALGAAQFYFCKIFHLVKRGFYGFVFSGCMLR